MEQQGRDEKLLAGSCGFDSVLALLFITLYESTYTFTCFLHSLCYPFIPHSTVLLEFMSILLLYFYQLAIDIFIYAPFPTQDLLDMCLPQSG